MPIMMNTKFRNPYLDRWPRVEIIVDFAIMAVIFLAVIQRQRDRAPGK